MTVAVELLIWLSLGVAVLAFVMAVLAMRQSERIAAVEKRLDQLPMTQQEMVDIRIKLAALAAKQESALTETHATRASIRRVEDFLMKSKRSGDYDTQF